MMPRGKRKTLEEQLASIDREIEACTTKLQTLQNERQTIVQAKRESELAALYDLLQESGRSVEDVARLLQDQAE